MSSFFKEYQKLNIGALNVTDMGRELYADMNKSGGVNRQDAQIVVTEALEQMKGHNLMITGGNLYTWPHTDYILSLIHIFRAAAGCISGMGGCMHA